MWFIFITARLFIFLSFQPRLAATLLRSCSVVNSPIRRAGLAPVIQPASLAQRLTWFDLVRLPVWETLALASPYLPLSPSI